MISPAEIERLVGDKLPLLAYILDDDGQMASKRVVIEAIATIRSLAAEVERLNWQPIETAPKDGTEFLSYGGPDNVEGKAQPTRWLSPGPFTTENGKNTEGQRRYQWPEGFYWAGYDGFVGPVSPTIWRPLPDPSATLNRTEASHEGTQQ